MISIDMSSDYIHTVIKIMYEILTDLNVLYSSFLKCKQGVDWKCSIQRYESNVLSNLNSLRKSLVNGTYKVSPYVEFNINERGKTRHIKSPTFNDRILQRAICDYILEPVLYKYLIYDNGASIKCKGVEFTRKRLNQHLHSYYRKYGNDGYILICDFRKFFDSIPHDKLIELLNKHIHDEKVMILLKQIIYSFSEDGKGLGIGSQISQICGVYYPTSIDNYCKIVKQCKYYGRHMDDFYIIHHDKEFLKKLLCDITKLSSELRLVLNKKKTHIYKINKGFSFLKQFIFVTETGKIIHRPIKKNIVRERKKLKSFKKKYDNKEMNLDDIVNCYKSWRGCTRKYNCYYSIKNMDKLFIKLFKVEGIYG